MFSIYGKMKEPGLIETILFICISDILGLYILNSSGLITRSGYCFVVVQLLSHVRLFDCSMPGFPVLHCLLEFAQTHVCSVNDTSLPSLPALNLSQQQGLFQRVGSLHQVAKLLELQLQSFQLIFRTDSLQD